MKQVVAAGLLFVALSGCQQNGGNGAGNASTNAGTATTTTNASAIVTPPAAPDPATQTGPVALASDASLPAPCQTVVRETQACIDNLSGPRAAFHEERLRLGLASSRETWASAQDDSYRGPMCERHLQALRQRVAEFGCATR